MAKSQYEYVKQFEQHDALLPHCYIVVRLDGKGFTKFCELHGFSKPNDARALRLMDAAATDVLLAFPEVCIAYGQSDEYSFVFRKSCQLYGRRASKLTTLTCSLFAAAFVRRWPEHLPQQPLLATPSFDARAVCYPSEKALRDYLAWRQVDCHVNNQYNTCFWALRQQGGLSGADAQAALRGTQTAAKNELLFTRFGINYNEVPPRFRKGSVLLWWPQGPAHELAGSGAAPAPDSEQAQGCARGADEASRGRRPKVKRAPVTLHEDIIGDVFWSKHADILAET